MVDALRDGNNFLVRVFSNYQLGEKEQCRFLSCSNPMCKDLEFRFNEGGEADLALVLNFPKIPSWVRVPSGGLVKILQEPVVRSYWTHRFTYRHSKIYDSVRTHSLLGSNDKRLVWDHPHLPMHVDNIRRSPVKAHLISVIASRLNILPGHKKRDRAVTAFLDNHPELAEHAFGRGRREIEEKSEGLEPYMYSVAIENDASNHYFTEKILDCFENLTVPIYFGAPDIADFFPRDSFISIVTLDPSGLESAVLKCSISDYQARLPALLEARELARQYSRLCCFVTTLRLDSYAGISPKKTHLLLPLDTMLTFLWRCMITASQMLKVYRPLIALAQVIRVAKTNSAKSREEITE